MDGLACYLGSARTAIALLRVRFHIIRNVCIENVGKSQSCMVSKLRIIWKQTVLEVRLGAEQQAWSLHRQKAAIAAQQLTEAQVSEHAAELTALKQAHGAELANAHWGVASAQEALRVRGHIIGHARNNM